MRLFQALIYLTKKTRSRTRHRLPFHLGVNGQILMHFAVLTQLNGRTFQQMRDGLEDYGPVREGVYAVTGDEGVAAHTSRWTKREHC